MLRRRGIAKGIITIMLRVANVFLEMPFFITGIVNDSWKESLKLHGGIEDESGDIKINYDRWRELNTKYGIAYLNREGRGYSETQPYLYDCCCIEELIMMLKAVKYAGYKKLVPFQYNGYKEVCSWDYVEQNRIDVER